MSPFVSKAQTRAMHAKANRGEISQAKIHEWDEATKAAGGFAKLPERVTPKAPKRKKPKPRRKP